jgi:hypothetical protein
MLASAQQRSMNRMWTGGRRSHGLHRCKSRAIRHTRRSRPSVRGWRPGVASRCAGRTEAGRCSRIRPRAGAPRRSGCRA